MANLPKHSAKDDVLEKTKRVSQEELDMLQKQIAEKIFLVEQFTATSDEVFHVKQILEEVTQELERKLNSLHEAETRLLQALVSEKAVASAISGKENAIDLLEIDREEKESNIRVLLNEIDELLEEKRELENILLEKDTQEKKLEALKSEIVSLENSKNLAELAVAALTKEAKDIESANIEKEREISERLASLSEREGAVSLKETQLAEKDEKLKLLQSELEEFYHRKFTHI